MPGKVIDLEWLNTFIAALTPVLVALIGAFQIRRERRSKREKELMENIAKKNAEEAAEEKAALVGTLETLTKRIESVGAQVEQIGTQVDSIAEDQNIQKRQLEKLSQITEVNLEYSRSIGNVVITMSNSLRATDIPDSEAVKLDAAITDFRNNEQKLLSKLYKAMY